VFHRREQCEKNELGTKPGFSTKFMEIVPKVEVLEQF
jgi:hypothetical protein